MLSLSQANTTIILLSVAITLLLLRNNCISLHQSSNFIWPPSNYPWSDTILFSITTYTVLSCATSTGTVNISSDANSIVLFPSEAYFSVILNDFNISSSVSIPVASYLFMVLSQYCFLIIVCLSMVLPQYYFLTIILWPNYYTLSFCKLKHWKDMSWCWRKGI